MPMDRSTAPATSAVVLGLLALVTVPVAVAVSVAVACDDSGCAGSEFAVAIAVVLSAPIALACEVGAVVMAVKARRIARDAGQGRRRAVVAVVLCAAFGLLVAAWLSIVAYNLSSA